MLTSRMECMPSRHVYAGVILNRTNQPVSCTIHYASNGSDEFDESISVIIDPGGRACIPERDYRPNIEATFACRKILARIDVRRTDQMFSLEQPFDGVSCPMTDWQFDIHEDHIASIDPNKSNKIN